LAYIGTWDATTTKIINQSNATGQWDSILEYEITDSEGHMLTFNTYFKRASGFLCVIEKGFLNGNKPNDLDMITDTFRAKDTPSNTTAYTGRAVSFDDSTYHRPGCKYLEIAYLQQRIKQISGCTPEIGIYSDTETWINILHTSLSSDQRCILCFIRQTRTSAERDFWDGIIELRNKLLQEQTDVLLTKLGWFK
jgi:hypothetical protein